MLTDSSAAVASAVSTAVWQWSDGNASGSLLQLSHAAVVLSSGDTPGKQLARH